MESSIKVANILKLLQMLDARLNNKFKVKWGFPTVTGPTPEESEEKIFSSEKLMIFLNMSLCEFNQCPSFSNFTFENSKFVEQFGSILVEGAVICALGSQALLEKGREYSHSDMASPPVADLLQEQYTQLLTLHWEKLKYIKQHIEDFKG